MIPFDDISTSTDRLREVLILLLNRKHAAMRAGDIGQMEELDERCRELTAELLRREDN